MSKREPDEGWTAENLPAYMAAETRRLSEAQEGRNKRCATS